MDIESWYFSGEPRVRGPRRHDEKGGIHSEKSLLRLSSNMGLIVCDLKKQRSVVEATSPQPPLFIHTTKNLSCPKHPTTFCDMKMNVFANQKLSFLWKLLKAFNQKQRAFIFIWNGFQSWQK